MSEALPSGATTGAEASCANCGAAFKSRNALFRHLRASECASPSGAGAAADHSGHSDLDDVTAAAPAPSDARVGGESAAAAAADARVGGKAYASRNAASADGASAGLSHSAHALVSQSSHGHVAMEVDDACSTRGGGLMAARVGRPPKRAHTDSSADDADVVVATSSDGRTGSMIGQPGSRTSGSRDASTTTTPAAKRQSVPPPPPLISPAAAKVWLGDIPSDVCTVRCAGARTRTSRIHTFTHEI
jgi:hypothetical protein